MFSYIFFFENPFIFLHNFDDIVPLRLAPFNFDGQPIYLGEYFQLVCTIIAGDLENVALNWMFQNETLYENNDRNILIEKNRRSSTLSIDAVQGRDAGEYICVGRNKAGVVTSTTNLIIKGNVG